MREFARQCVRERLGTDIRPGKALVCWARRSRTGVGLEQRRLQPTFDDRWMCKQTARMDGLRLRMAFADYCSRAGRV